MSSFYFTITGVNENSLFGTADFLVHSKGCFPPFSAVFRAMQCSAHGVFVDIRLTEELSVTPTMINCLLIPSLFRIRGGDDNELILLSRPQGRRR